jgi:23S rRNA pseudouridine2605 synthase
VEERIQKVLARMGVASRRAVEEMIADGRVTVNGELASVGMKVDASRAHIKVDGKLVFRPEPRIYLMLNKPQGVVSTLSDPEGRPTVKDFLRGVKYRVFPVGRLDYDSEGLILLTNDGDFSNALLHPSKKIPKTYVVKVKGIMPAEKVLKLRQGIRLEDGRTQPARVRTIRESGANSWVEITITEGRKRQIRRMVEAVGHPAIKLRRISINGVKLADLDSGAIRPLTDRELKILREEML